MQIKLIFTRKVVQVASFSKWPFLTWEWLRILYEVLHEVHTIKSRFVKMTKYVQKCSRNRTPNKKGSNFEKNELNFKLLKGTEKLNGPFYPGDLVTRIRHICK